MKLKWKSLERNINMKNFEDLTIGELKKLHKQFMEQNPEFKTVFELLEENVKYVGSWGKILKKPKI